MSTRPANYSVSNSGSDSEGDGYYSGSVEVKFSNISHEKWLYLEEEILKVVQRLRVSKGLHTPTEAAEKSGGPSAVGEKSHVRGRLVTFLHNLNVPENEVVVRYRQKYPKRGGDSDEEILDAWREGRKMGYKPPAIDSPSMAFVPGDKVRYIPLGESAKVGEVVEIVRNGTQMTVRFGVNDVKKVHVSDYELVRKGDEK